MVNMETVQMIGIVAKFRTWIEILKPRLSMLVAFSCSFGFVLSNQGKLDWLRLTLLTLGGFLLSGASVIINQIIERKEDGIMHRTMARPLPTGRISVAEAWILALACFSLSLGLLYWSANQLTILLSVLSMLLYSFVYTPMKKIGPIAVFVGAIPGALPPLLGWIANTATISYEAMVIFGIQFIWQFPHFWAIAWVSDDDYKKAGFRLLPSGGGKDHNTSIQIMTYTLFLLPLGLLPAWIGLTGINSAVVATLCGTGFLTQTFSLMKTGSNQSARRIMFGSFLYLPIVQIAYLLDKL
ncbi:MAG: protoheme IX farnesyltransferase [Bacteroidetes bacterium]|nr:protoheme IX farnesyltransferase [Bacteroidota bacterium]